MSQAYPPPRIRVLTAREVWTRFLAVVTSMFIALPTLGTLLIVVVGFTLFNDTGENPTALSSTLRWYLLHVFVTVLLAVAAGVAVLWTAFANGAPATTRIVGVLAVVCTVAEAVMHGVMVWDVGPQGWAFLSIPAVLALAVLALAWNRGPQLRA